jgi:2-oxoglutarate ferredoxin oxidoreductase subunit alpha
VIGAAWNGARAFTATSGPGISLMQEFLGLAYFAEIPAVVFDVQRAGPSTGMPTRTQQCDLISCAYASHGDTKHVLLFPEDPAEAFEFGALAFDLADRLQTPVLRDARPRHRHEPSPHPAARLGRRETIRPRQGDDGGRPRRRQGIRPLPRRRQRRHSLPHLSGAHPSKGAFFTRGTSRDRYARYTEEGAPYADNMQRLLRKFETARTWCRARCAPMPRSRPDTASSISARPRPRWTRRSAC